MFISDNHVIAYFLFVLAIFILTVVFITVLKKKLIKDYYANGKRKKNFLKNMNFYKGATLYAYAGAFPLIICALLLSVDTLELIMLGVSYILGCLVAGSLAAEYYRESDIDN